ncbi:glycerol-3-phosphate responsive antiterminator [Paenibacillus sp. 7124]|uniref:Glycerol uptake operon antiterminator regulatory protein n=1 Tax=Paenibacillus apii TaxID=1850370 RepID=A0A6M1PPR8_9BACL|nr:glycerol-3-phosphate responsive antiterminator [Paenibacillus apii]NGM85280.1 glycerol-3-phosphate responsive antiterminator [Paenibacillus apii]NJJ41847.1 glycerol-3-phosphate responsive antiterminator [Paenibacillus apii]
MSLLYKIGNNPIIAAVRKPEDIEAALDSRVENLFFMGCNVKEIIQAVRLTKECKKGAFVHLDLIRGLSSTDKESVDFISDYVGADGIVTPKSHLIKEAKRVGLYGILHLFVIDSAALHNGLKAAGNVEPDAIELMPGAIPKIIRSFAETLEHIPIVASGLIQTKTEAGESLQAGATSLSVSDPALWNCSFDDLQ